MRQLLGHNQHAMMLALTQCHEATQCLAPLEHVTGALKELGLHAWVALVAVLAVHVPAASAVLQVLQKAAADEHHDYDCKKLQHGGRVCCSLRLLLCDRRWRSC
jgi:hypothetical protein